MGSMCLRLCRFRCRRWLRQWAQKGASGSAALCTIELAKGPSLYRSLICARTCSVLRHSTDHWVPHRVHVIGLQDGAAVLKLGV